MWKRGPESVGSFQKRWMWVVQHPKPCLRIYENIQSESEMELVGKSHNLMKLVTEFSPHEIVNTRNGLDIVAKHKKKRKKSLRRREEQELKNCEFQFQTMDEVEHVKGENDAEFVGLVHIHIIEAKNIPKMDSNGLTDAYCTCTLETSTANATEETPEDAPKPKHHFFRRAPHEAEKLSHRTQVFENSLSPTWEEAFAYRITTTEGTLRFLLADHDPMSSDDVFGEVMVPVEGIVNGDISSMVADIQPVEGGPDLEDGETLGQIYLQFDYATQDKSERALVRWTEDDEKHIDQVRQHAIPGHPQEARTSFRT